MKRVDALEISNLAGFMLLAVEKHLADRWGIVYPLLQEDIDRLPLKSKLLLDEIRSCRKAVTDKVVPMIED